MQKETASRWNSEEDKVLMPIMKIPRLDGERGYKSVLWGTACSGIFVSMEHVERMSFSSKEKRLRVMTLGEVKKEIYSRIYDCKIKDLKNDTALFTGSKFYF